MMVKLSNIAPLSIMKSRNIGWVIGIDELYKEIDIEKYKLFL